MLKHYWKKESKEKVKRRILNKHTKGMKKKDINEEFKIIYGKYLEEVNE